MFASYAKYTSPGAGFFAGTNTQVASFGYTRPLGRTWTFYGDLGYSHNTRIQSVLVGGVNAGSYNVGSAGAVLRKHLGRTFDFFSSYRFSELAFDVPVSIGGSRGRISRQQTGAVGVEWHPRPTRIE